MSLESIQQSLQASASAGTLTFTTLGQQAPATGLILMSLPPIGQVSLKGAVIDLQGQGAGQTLTVTAAADWGLLTGVAVKLVLTPDPSSADGVIAALTLTAPPSTQLAIPGVDWFAIDAFAVQGSTFSASDTASGLLPPAALAVTATLVMGGDKSQTPLPITVGNGVTGGLLVQLNTAAVDLPSINDILAAFGSPAGISLPPTLNDLAHFSLKNIQVGFDPAAGTVSLIGVEIGNSASASGGWKILPGVLELDSYDIQLVIADPLHARAISGTITTTATLGTVDVQVVAAHPASGGWSFRGVIGKENPVPVGELVSGLGSQFGVALPDVLSTLTLNDFEFAFDTATYDASGEFTLAFDVNGTPVSLTASAALTHQTGGKYALAVDGKLHVGAALFEVTFAKSTFTATWSDTANPLGFGDLASAFGFTDLPPVPASLDLDLVSASITYDSSARTLVLTATSRNPAYGSAAFVARAGTYFFGVRMGETIDLTNLPLLRSVLSADERVQITDIQAVIASAALDVPAATAINALLTGTGMPQAPAAGLARGLALSMTFKAGSFSQPLSISTGGAPPAGGGTLAPASGTAGGGTRALAAGDAAPPAATGAASNGTVSSSTSPDGTVWYDLQKKFGPVSFQKVGIRYQTSADGRDGVLYVVMNAGLDAGGLSIAVLGLGVGSPLTTFAPEFTITGITVTLAEGPLEVSGALVGSLDPVSFYGELVLGFRQLSISALGGYAELEGHPSFFLYAVADYPIGGPAFFFVTGLSAGLGYNRALLVPDITGVPSFPLVAWARGNGAPGMDPGGDVGTQVMKVMGGLQSSGVIAPSLGAYWLALGVRFTSFELIDAFALVTVTFGTRFEVDLLGVATLSIPPQVTPPIALVELALKASFAPDRGLLSVEGQLTSNSYVLDPAAHLTGGFAFYAWYAGDHEGDFVVTLGGYNPAFTVPDYYPTVPRLGLNWEVVPGTLTIQGGLYFALTSNAVMAGGEMSAVWSSGPISAWFTVWADFLMIFKPFHYAISAGIDLGAAFSIKILFVHVRISIHVGVQLQIWGPPFAGVATVDLSIISFSIHFGSGGAQTDTTLQWPDFVSQLLPSSNPAPQPARAAAPRFSRAALVAPAPASGDAASGPPAVVQVAVTRGLRKTLDATPSHPWYLVSSEAFQCQVTTAIPFKSATWGGIASQAPDAQQPHDASGALIQPNTSFSAGIAGIAAGDFNPALSIQVESGEDSSLLGVRVLRNAPKALWETKNFSNGVPQEDPATALTQTTIPNALSGFVLIPEAPEPDHTLEIPLPVLEFTLEDVQPFAWSTPAYATTDPFTTQTVAGTITSPAVAGVRAAILGALAGQSLPVDTSVAVQGLANPANNDLMAAPALRLLGEQRAAAATASEAP